LKHISDKLELKLARNIQKNFDLM